MKKVLLVLIVFVIISSAFVSCEKNDNIGGNVSKDDKITTSGEEESEKEDKRDLSDAEIGSTVQFGTYEQDSYEETTNEPVEWIVLAKEDDRILVISKIILESKPYNESDEEVEITWKDCSVREWLNDTFFNTAFNEKEKSMIIATEVSNEIRTGSDIVLDGNVTDKVFLLSADEAQKYFASNEARTCEISYYLKKRGYSSAYENSEGKRIFRWALRTPGHLQSTYSEITAEGGVWTYGDYCYVEGFIRPAMWIDIKH